MQCEIIQMFGCKGRDTIKTLKDWEKLYKQSCYYFGFVCEEGEFKEWAEKNLFKTKVN